MTEDITRRYKEDDPDELWDDDLRIATTSDAEDRDGENAGIQEDVGGRADIEIQEKEKKPRKKGLFGLTHDEEGDDFFDNDPDPEQEPVEATKPKQVKLDPEDPDYWMDDESDFDHIMPKPRKAWIWWTAGAVTLLGILVGLWVWFFTPYTDGAVKYGYLKSMERRGTFVKTFEGVLIPYRELGDSTPTYFEEIRFSVDGDSLAAHMKGMMLNCIPVRLEYEKYHTPLFWKGAETMVIVKADTADANKILPPEYR